MKPRARLVGGLMRWEAVLVGLILAAGIWSSTLSPVFLTTANLLDVATPYMYLGILALGLTFVVVAGEIDISVASTMTVAGVVFAELLHAGAAPMVAALAAVGTGAMLGAINGVLVAFLELPSLAITLGTLAAYRGLAFVIIGDGALTNPPHGFVTNLGAGYISGELPESLLVFIACAVALGVALHGTRFGRYLYASGASREASRFSGVPEITVRIGVFVVAGIMAGVAAIVYDGFFGSIQADAASGTELLSVITAVVLGGVSIFGGSGTMVGVVLAFVLVAVLNNGMQLANISSSTTDLVIGALLLVAIMAGNALGALGGRRRAEHVRDPGETGATAQEEASNPLSVPAEVQKRNEVDVNARQ
jgi:rhamnose transport system permease protein